MSMQLKVAEKQLKDIFNELGIKEYEIHINTDFGKTQISFRIKSLSGNIVWGNVNILVVEETGELQFVPCTNIDELVHNTTIVFDSFEKAVKFIIAKHIEEILKEIKTNINLACALGMTKDKLLQYQIFPE